MASARVAQRVAVARAGTENLRPAELAAELASAHPTLIDVRGAEETTAGIIAGAIVVPRGLLEFSADPSTAHPSTHGRLARFAPDQRLILYCTDGGRSALAVHVLYELGYVDVALLDGGLAAWLADGRSLVAPS